MQNRKIFPVLIAIALILPYPADARRAVSISKADTEKISADLAAEFKLTASELMPLVENLEQAAGGEDFYYYLNRIRQLSEGQRHTLVEFLKCICALEERPKADLVFALVESMDRLSPSSYCVNSVLTDISGLPAELDGIKGGFEALLNMLTEITRIDPKKKDVQPDAYDFLRRFKEEVIAQGWKNYEYIRGNFMFTMEKVTQIMSERLERFCWDVFSQINICLNQADGDSKEADLLLRKYYEALPEK
ncbi:MAG: hypothetical protein PHQ54_05725 [Candidatus Omnitrophica bacterium]|nr:hypothetical protein [Candidatus Omnitrophota bacterium]